MDLLESQLSILDIIEESPSGISYIGGGSDFSKLVDLNVERLHRFFSQLELLVKSLITSFWIWAPTSLLLSPFANL